jgi:hypothetical protein
MSLRLLSGAASAQCNTALYEAGGLPGPICFATSGHQAVGRGRFVCVESTPSSGAPAVVGRIALGRPAVHMTTEFSGQVWATDGPTVYALDTSTPSTPRLLGRYDLQPSAEPLERLRVRGGLVYALSPSTLFILDAANPSAPALRSAFTISGASARDVEVVGGFAYLSIQDFSAAAASLMVVDVTNPDQPVEGARLGSGGRSGLRLTSRSGTLFALTKTVASGALEAWSLATPSIPSLASANTTIGPDAYLDDELRFGLTSGGPFGVSALVWLQTHARTLRIYNTSLAQVNAFTFDSDVRGHTLESTRLIRLEALVTRAPGELARAGAITAASPTLDQRYLDVPPGWAEKVALGNGFAVLSTTELLGENSLSFFLTPSGGPPTLLANMRPDPGYAWVPGMLAAIDNVVFAVEKAAPGSVVVIVYTVSITPTPGVHFVNAFAPPGFGEIFGLDAGIDATNTRRLYLLKASQFWIMNADNPASMSYVGNMGVPADITGPLRFIPASPALGTPPRVLIAGRTGRTQIVSVASVNPPASQGFIPASADHIVPGTFADVWLRHQNMLYGYNIANPAAPVLRSALGIAPPTAQVTDAIATASGTRLYATTTMGDLVEVNIANPATPTVIQSWRTGITPGNYGAAATWGLAYDGARFHTANGAGGYAVVEVPCACYADCDSSASLNVNDFICFQSRFAAAQPYADCDGSGALNVNDFICFQSRFAAGCN